MLVQLDSLFSQLFEQSVGDSSSLVILREHNTDQCNSNPLVWAKPTLTSSFPSFPVVATQTSRSAKRRSHLLVFSNRRSCTNRSLNLTVVLGTNSTDYRVHIEFFHRRKVGMAGQRECANSTCITESLLQQFSPCDRLWYS